MAKVQPILLNLVLPGPKTESGCEKFDNEFFNLIKKHQDIQGLKAESNTAVKNNKEDFTLFTFILDNSVVKK
jgi:hypothetical protein